MHLGLFACGVITLGLVGCEEDLVAEHPDAGLDAPAPLVGDFSCQETAWPTAAPDPLTVRGQVFDQTFARLADVPIEIRDLATDALLAQGMTGNGTITIGRYNITTPTGGLARAFYRRVLPTNGYPVHTIVDPIAEFRQDVSYAYLLQAPQAAAYYAQLTGTTSDPSTGGLLVDINDCDLTTVNTVAGATVEVPAGVSVLYVDPQGHPDVSLTATSSKGEVLLGNVPPGQFDVVIHAGPVTYRSWPVPIHAGEWTYSQRMP